MNETNIPQTSPNELQHLKQQMLLLGERVERLETKLDLAPQPKAPVTPPVPQAVPPMPRPQAVTPPPVPAPQPVFAPNPSAAVPMPTGYAPGWKEPKPKRHTKSSALSLGDWENLIGGKWALWIGSLCLFLAMASFLAYTWAALPPAPPWARVTMGMLSGLAMMGAGGFLRPRTKRYFSEGISGAGLSICYLSLWAGSQYFSVLSPIQSFVGMALLTALGVGLALRYDALSLSVLSTLGGFLTPALVGSQGSGGGSAVPFLTYVALLNAGILAVSLRKRWRGLVWLSFTCTVLLVGGWWLNSHIEAVRVALFLFTTLTFGQYMAAATFYSLIHREETTSKDLLLLFASTSLYAFVGYNLAEPFMASFPAAFPLALAAFFGLLNLTITKIAPTNTSLRYSAGGLALLAVTIAVPLQLHHAALTIGWITEAAVLLFLSGKLKSPLLRRAGQTVWLLTGVPLFQECVLPFSPSSSLLSSSALPLAVCAGVSAFLSWNARRSNEESDAFEPAYAIAAVIGGGWLLAQEIYRSFELHLSTLSQQWTGNAYLVIATVLAIYSLATFALGIKCRHEVVRWCALIGTTVIACTSLFSMYATANEPTAATVAMHWPASLIAFGGIGLVLAAIAALLCGKESPLSPSEKETAHAWTCGTVLFLLAGASIHLYCAFSINRAAFGAEWKEIAVYGLSMFWCLSASLLLYLGCRWRDKWLRCLAVLTGGGALVALITSALIASLPGLPFFNWRVACFGAAIVGLHFSAFTLRRNLERISSWEKDLPVTLNCLSLFLLLWLLTQESYETSRYYQDLLGTYWQRQAQMVVSLVWSVFGAMLLLAGIRKRQQPLRVAALGLLAATVVKVFIFDLSYLDGASRIFSLGGLGVSLIFISWLYSRFGSEKREAPPLEASS